MNNNSAISVTTQWLYYAFNPHYVLMLSVERFSYERWSKYDYRDNIDVNVYIWFVMGNLAVSRGGEKEGSCLPMVFQWTE